MATALMALAGAASGSAQTALQQRLPVITQVAQIRRLTAQEARRAYPVNLRGVLTYCMPELGLTFVQDSTAGIFVNFVNAHGEALGGHAGDLVEVSGVTGPGFFAPEVENPQIRVLGKAPLPTALRFPLEDLLTGKEDSQWVEIRGIVRSVAYEDVVPPTMAKGPPSLVLGISAGNNKFKARIKEFRHDADYGPLTDAVVTVRGACATLV